MKKPKTYTYPRSAIWIHDGKKLQYATQQYEVGTYFALYIDGRIAQQNNFVPKDVIKFAKKLQRMEAEGTIAELTFSTEITVTSKSGLWETIDAK